MSGSIFLTLIRHGATAGNLEKRYIGRTDEPLCPAGVAQLQALRGRKIPVGRLFVSPMRRARQSAALLFPNASYVVVDGLRETDFGIFEGKTAEELSGDPRYRQWVDSGCQEPVPSGEGVTDFKKRCQTAFTAAMETVEPGASAVFVTHGGVIMAVLEAFAVPRQTFYAYHIENGATWSGIYAGGTILS